MLAMRDIDSVVFDGAKPNPSIANVEAGLACCRRALRLRGLAGRRFAP
jgi:alcohol dehydrogenase